MLTVNSLAGQTQKKTLWARFGPRAGVCPPLVYIIMHGPQSKIHGVKSKTHSLQSTVHGLQKTHGLQSTVHGLTNTRSIIYNTRFITWPTIYNTRFITWTTHGLRRFIKHGRQTTIRVHQSADHVKRSDHTAHM